MNVTIQNRIFARGYIKGWVDASSGINVPEALTDAIKELSRLANREEAGLVPDRDSRSANRGIHRPLIVSRKTTRKPISQEGDAAHVWNVIKDILHHNNAMMPKDVVIALEQQLGDKIVQRYIANKSGKVRVGQLLVYHSKNANPEVRRVADGYELTTFGSLEKGE